MGNFIADGMVSVRLGNSEKLALSGRPEEATRRKREADKREPGFLRSGFAVQYRR